MYLVYYIFFLFNYRQCRVLETVGKLKKRQTKISFTLLSDKNFIVYQMSVTFFHIQRKGMSSLIYSGIIFINVAVNIGNTRFLNCAVLSGFKFVSMNLN